MAHTAVNLMTQNKKEKWLAFLKGCSVFQGVFFYLIFFSSSCHDIFPYTVRQVGDASVGTKQDLLVKDSTPFAFDQYHSADVTNGGDRDHDKIPDDVDPFPDVPNQLLYFRSPGDHLSDYVLDGTWSTDEKTLCHTDPKDHKYMTMLNSSFISTNDYLAEVKLDVLKFNVTTDYWAGIGIGFRISGFGSYAYDAYICEADLQNRRLALGKYVDSNYTLLKATANGSLPKETTYRLRAIAKGDQLTCLDLASGLKVTSTNASYSTGSVGFFNYQVSGCYEYLLLIEAP